MRQRRHNGLLHGAKDGKYRNDGKYGHRQDACVTPNHPQADKSLTVRGVRILFAGLFAVC